MSITQRPTKGWSLCARRLAACALVLTVVGVASPTFARSNFDGEWSVVIETRGGSCVPTVRYPLAINNGIVSSAGNTSAAVTGRVTPTGTVKVTVQSGGSRASGSGRLNATRGAGVWRGQGSSGFCTGTWQAERRTAGAPIYGYAPQGSLRYSSHYYSDYHYSGYPAR